MKVKIQKVVDLDLIPDEFHKELEPLFRKFTSAATELDNLQTQAPLLVSARGAEAVCVGLHNVRRALYEIDSVLDGWLGVALDLENALKEEEGHQTLPKEEEDGG